jgi:hypothetical protein
VIASGYSRHSAGRLGTVKAEERRQTAEAERLAAQRRAQETERRRAAKLFTRFRNSSALRHVDRDRPSLIVREQLRPLIFSRVPPRNALLGAALVELRTKPRNLCTYTTFNSDCFFAPLWMGADQAEADKYCFGHRTRQFR